MGEAEREIHILVRRPENMRHVVVVAHDLHRRADARQGVILGVINQRPRQDVIGQRKADQAQPDKAPRINQRKAVSIGGPVLDGGSRFGS